MNKPVIVWGIAAAALNVVMARRLARLTDAAFELETRQLATATRAAAVPAQRKATNGRTSAATSPARLSLVS